MRFYELFITRPDGTAIVPDGSGGFTTGSGPTFSSLVRDRFTGRMQSDPGALNIDCDFPVSTFDIFQGAQRIKVWGIGLRMIGQAADLAGYNVTLKAGMAPGLPLANPAQAGVILQGNVYEAFGNWQGVNQTLDLLVNPGTNQSLLSVPIPFYWPAGTSLDDAIDNALSQSFPNLKHQIYIDANLTLANDEVGYYQNFAQFASYLKGISLKAGSQIIPNYQGVSIAMNGDTVNVFDGQNGGPSSVTVQLKFPDLIGQPTWIGPTLVSFKTVLRADINVGNRIKFPVTSNGSPAIVLPYALTSPSAAFPGANTPSRSSTAFQGEFVVKEIHHFLNFREPDADSWATAFVATTAPGL